MLFRFNGKKIEYTKKYGKTINMISKSIIILYSYNKQNKTQILIGKHKEYNDYMFIGGGKKKTESMSMCASREIYEETKTLIGPIDYIHSFIRDSTFKCRPINVIRNIQRNDKTIDLRLQAHVYFMRIPYLSNINELFQEQVEHDDICYNELSEIRYVSLDEITKMKKEFFPEDIEILDQLHKESDLKKLININQRKQNKTPVIIYKR